MMREWGMGLYVIGSAVAWLIIGEIFTWHTGVVVGSTVALIGTVLFFLDLGQEHQLGYGGAFAVCLIPASFPIGLLAQTNNPGAPGSLWFWVTAAVAGAGVLLIGCKRLSIKVKAKWGTS